MFLLRFILRKLGVVFVGEDYRYENNPAKGIVVKTVSNISFAYIKDDIYDKNHEAG